MVRSAVFMASICNVPYNISIFVADPGPKFTAELVVAGYND